MIHWFAIAFSVTALAANVAAADPIEGRWQTEDGPVAAIAACGDSFCITGTGKHAGRQAGRMTANGDGTYAGTIIRPRDGKTYSGKAVLSGNSLKVSGCILGGLICESQTWHRK